MVSKVSDSVKTDTVTLVPAAATSKTKDNAKASSTEKVSAAASKSLSGKEKEAKGESAVSLTKAKPEDLTEEVNKTIGFPVKELRARLEKEKKPSTLRKVIICVILAAIVLVVALPWLAPVAFGESLFAWKITAIVFGGSVIPPGLCVGWRLGFGGTPYHTKINKMISALDNDTKVNKYIQEISDLIQKKYTVPSPKDRPKGYSRGQHFKESLLRLAADPATFDFLRDPKNKTRKSVEDARRQIGSLEKRKDALEEKDDSKKEADEVTKDIDEWKKTLTRYQTDLDKDEEALFTKHGFILNQK